jgi:hypothetical protein
MFLNFIIQILCKKKKGGIMSHLVIFMPHKITGDQNETRRKTALM